jgi:hypothetical protein
MTGGMANDRRIITPMPDDLIDMIEDYRWRRRMSRSAAIRDLIDLGLSCAEAATNPDGGMMIVNKTDKAMILDPDELAQVLRTALAQGDKSFDPDALAQGCEPR